MQQVGNTKESCTFRNNMVYNVILSMLFVYFKFLDTEITYVLKKWMLAGS